MKTRFIPNESEDSQSSWFTVTYGRVIRSPWVRARGSVLGRTTWFGLAAHLPKPQRLMGFRFSQCRADLQRQLSGARLVPTNFGFGTPCWKEFRLT